MVLCSKSILKPMTTWLDTESILDWCCLRMTSKHIWPINSKRKKGKLFWCLCKVSLWLGWREGQFFPKLVGHQRQSTQKQEWSRTVHGWVIPQTFYEDIFRGSRYVLAGQAAERPYHMNKFLEGCSVLPFRRSVMLENLLALEVRSSTKTTYQPT